MIYDGKLTDLMPLTLETFTTHPKAKKIYYILIIIIELVLKIREMKFNARENLASWFLAYVKYIKILQLILDTGEHHHTTCK